MYQTGQKYSLNASPKGDKNIILNGAKEIEILKMYDDGMVAKSDINQSIYIPNEYFEHLLRTRKIELNSDEVS